MAVYLKNGIATNDAYNVNGVRLSQAYDINKKELLGEPEYDDIVPNRLLIWHDEFDSSAVDPTKWNHLFGYYGNYRYYMYENDLAHNAYCRDSILHITNEKDSTMPLTDWTGASIRTNNLFEFRYGLIEAKIKFPNNPVYHSTLWTLGAGHDQICTPTTTPDESVGELWPACGENDIAEADNGTVTTTKHWAKYPQSQSSEHVSGGHATLTKDASNWHIYGCEWTENTIKVYVDRVLKSTFNVSDATVGGFNPFQRPHFLIFNQNPYLSGTQSQDFLETLVDWIRVYAPVGVTEYIIETAISIENSVSLGVGETHFLETTFTPINPSDMTIVWSSSNENVAICHGGKITALASGTAVVTATSKHGHQATCLVTVI